MESLDFVGREKEDGERWAGEVGSERDDILSDERSRMSE